MQGRSLAPAPARSHAGRLAAQSSTTATTTTPATTIPRATSACAPTTHKLIHFWKKDQWELFDLVADPDELKNLYGQPGTEQLTATLKRKLGSTFIETVRGMGYRIEANS